eukprot:TRINITY_DN838_c0_g1_i1.p1 TRINITY_DN838_c0_g1~~TRINITY_DN838_c0_g1_i1.p1  ORF type:complete len:1607 (+),score=523.91 TRINITY_DN838_c0_g1_i1:73-4893(+)
MADDPRIVRVQARCRGHLARIKYKVALKQFRHRNNVVMEVLQKETNFIKFMNATVNNYITPLRIGKYKGILPEEKIQAIFGNLNEIINVDLVLLHELEAECKTPYKARIGAALLKVLPFLKAYTTYIDTFDKRSGVLNECMKISKFSTFLEKVRSSDVCGGLSLPGLLIMPIQHIPRLKLLVEQLLKYTDDDHLDKLDLEQSNEQLHRTAAWFEQSVRDRENRDQIVEIQGKFSGMAEEDQPILQPHRRLIRQGILRPTNFNIGKKNQCFVCVFNDCIVVAAKDSKGMLHKRAMLPIVAVRCEDVIDDPESVTLRIVTTVMVLQLAASTQHEKQLWLSDLKQTSNSALDAILEKRQSMSVDLSGTLDYLDSPRSPMLRRSFDVDRRRSMGGQFEAVAHLTRLETELQEAKNAHAAAMQKLRQERDAIATELATLQAKIGAQPIKIDSVTSPPQAPIISSDASATVLAVTAAEPVAAQTASTPARSSLGQTTSPSPAGEGGERLKEALTEANHLRSELAAQRVENQSLHSRLSAYETQLPVKVLHQEITVLKKKLAESEKSVNDHKHQIQVIRTEMLETEEKHDKLKKESQDIVDSAQRMEAEHTTEVQRISKHCDALQAKLKEVFAQLLMAQQESKELRDWQSTAVDQHNRALQSHAQLAAQVSSIDNVQQQLLACQHLVADYEQRHARLSSENEKLVDQLQKAQQECVGLKKELLAALELENEIRARENALRSAQEEHQRLVAQQSQLHAQFLQAQEELAHKQQELLQAEARYRAALESGELTAQALEDLERTHLEQIALLSKQRDAVIDQLAETKRALDETQTRSRETETRLAVLQTDAQKLAEATETIKQKDARIDELTLQSTQTSQQLVTLTKEMSAQQLQHTLMLDKQLTKHEEMIVELNAQHAATVDRINKQHSYAMQSAIDQHTETLNAAKQLHLSDMATMRKQHELATQAINEQHEAAIADLQEVHSKKQRQLERDIAEAVLQRETADTERDAAQSRVDTLMQEHTKEMRRAQQELEASRETAAQLQTDLHTHQAAGRLALAELERKHQDFITEANAEHSAHVRTVKDTHADEMAVLHEKHKEAVEELKQQHAVAMSELRQQGDTECTILKLQHHEATNNLKQQHELTLSHLRADYEKRLLRANQDREQQLADLQDTMSRDAEQRLADMSRTFTDRLRTKMQEVDMLEIQLNMKTEAAEADSSRIRELQSKVDLYMEENAHLIQGIAEREATYERLKIAQELTMAQRAPNEAMLELSEQLRQARANAERLAQQTAEWRDRDRATTAKVMQLAEREKQLQEAMTLLKEQLQRKSEELSVREQRAEQLKADLESKRLQMQDREMVLVSRDQDALEQVQQRRKALQEWFDTKSAQMAQREQEMRIREDRVSKSHAKLRELSLKQDQDESLDVIMSRHRTEQSSLPPRLSGTRMAIHELYETPQRGPKAGQTPSSSGQSYHQQQSILARSTTGSQRLTAGTGSASLLSPSAMQLVSSARSRSEKVRELTQMSQRALQRLKESLPPLIPLNDFASDVAEELQHPAVDYMRRTLTALVTEVERLAAEKQEDSEALAHYQSVARDLERRVVECKAEVHNICVELA